MDGELRLDAVMKSIDVYGRLAFGGQCIAAMAILAAPLIFAAAAVAPFRLWDDNRGEALFVWLGGWLLAVAVGAGGVAFGVFCWRWSGDWITEWPGYAVGFGFAAVALVALGALVVAMDLSLYMSLLITVGALFLAGVLVAGNLGGARLLPQQRRQRALARRR
jgi:hypothetical protein